MLRTRNLKKVFLTNEVETSALTGIDLTIHKGEFVAIMGPSGCGKSTLLNILGLLDQPSHGSYSFYDQSVENLRENHRVKLRRGNIGFVFQSFNLIDELNVYENVELPLLYLKTPAKERHEKVENLLKRLNIMHRRNHFPPQLSGGQQQRVAIARAVISKPKVIFADEPTGNLDSVCGEDVMMLLRELNRNGTTIVMVTHSAHDAEFAHRTVNMIDGRIVEEGFIIN